MLPYKMNPKSHKTTQKITKSIKFQKNLLRESQDNAKKLINFYYTCVENGTVLHFVKIETEPTPQNFYSLDISKIQYNTLHGE